MNPVNSTRSRELFDQALEHPRGERDAFIAGACADDPTVEREVKDLLRAFDQAEHALEPASRQPADEDPSHSLVGARIGSYHIRRLIAAGGMGAVYEATQERPRRTIALKLMKQGIASRSALRRFEYESQVLARLHHPGIAQIYEAGTHDDGSGAIPYFAMEYIPAARSLTQYAAELKLGTRQRLELFITVCEAVHHGHQKGIIHRDLKPSNILVDSTGQAKVIDFGVARATDSDMALTTLQTDIGQLIGTVQYMSPEQCAADPHDIDTRSDVYALGVILYELLCERLPHELTRIALPEAMRRIREQPPPRPSGFDRALRGDVETIVLKALEKERSRRYQSAGDVGEDIKRYLRHEPILARPPSVIYQLRTFARRNRAVVGALAGLFSLLLITIVVVGSLLVRAERERTEKEVIAMQKEKIASDAVALFGQQLTGAVASADRQRNERLARDLIEIASGNLQSKFIDQPEILGECLGTLGTAYTTIGDFHQAEQYCARALTVHMNALGDGHPQTVNSRNRLAWAYRNLGNHLRAEELYLQSLETIRRQGLASVSCREPLADMYLDIGRCTDAEAILQEAITVASAPGNGPEGPVYFMTNLASVYRTQRRLDEADTLLREAINLFPPPLAGAGDALAAYRPVRELARLRLVQGRLEEARTLQQQALEGYRRYPNAVPDWLDMILCVELGGLIDLQQNRIEQAEEQFISAADLASQTFNSEHMWFAAHFRVDHAVCLMRRQEYDRAEPMLLSAYDVLRERLGDMHHRTQNCIRALVDLYESTQQPEQAARWRARLRQEGCL